MNPALTVPYNADYEWGLRGCSWRRGDTRWWPWWSTSWENERQPPNSRQGASNWCACHACRESRGML